MILKKRKLIWYIKGNLGDCILSCYSLLKIDLSYIDITICTNKTNSKLIKELNLPFKILEIDDSLLSILNSYSILKFIKQIFKNYKYFFNSFDVSIDSYRWRSGFALDQFFSIKQKLKLNRFTTKKYDIYNFSEIDIHTKYFDIANIPYFNRSIMIDIIKENSKAIVAPFFDIIIHPFSSEKTRILKIDFINQIILSHQNEKILLLGTPNDDVNFIQELRKLKNNNLTIEIKNFNFLYLAALMLQTRKIYGSESFISNFSSILSLNTVGFFSGVADPKQWFLQGEFSRTIRINVPCSPCFNKYICNNECLDFDYENLSKVI